MSNFKCEYCLKLFASQYNLTRHQKSAKYCQKIQTLTCQTCKQSFDNPRQLNKHIGECVNKHKEFLDKLYTEMKGILAKPTIINNDYSKKSVKSKTTIYNNLIPLTKEWINNSAQQITIEDVSNGAQGIGTFIAKNTLKDRAVSTDVARRVVTYIDEGGEKVRDVKGIKLLQPICDSLQQPVEKHYQVIKENQYALVKEAGPQVTEQILNNILTLTQTNVGIRKIANGEQHEVQNKLIGHICLHIQSGPQE